MNRSTMDEARAAKAVVEGLLRNAQNLVGVAATRVEQGYGVKITLSAALTGALKVPEQINGVPVIIEITEPLRKRVIR